MKLTNMMKKAQEMQAKMQEMQAKLADITVEGQSGNGLVKTVMTGLGVLQSVEIDESLLSGDEKDVIEDLIVVAVNDAKEKVEALVASETQSIMGGMGLPGGLPF